MSVKFLKGALSQYEDIKSQGLINEDTFYYIYKSQPYGEDDGLRQLYLGENRLSNASELAAAVERIAANETDIANLQTWADLILKEDESAEGGATGIIASMGAQIGTNQTNIAANAEAIEELEAQIKAITGEDSGSISDIVDAAIAESEAKTNAAIKANTDAIDAIEADYLTSADKTELEGKIKVNTDAITVLNSDSTVEGSVDKKVADAINEFSTAMTDNGTVDTFKEIVNYISTHGGEAAEMAGAITALETKVGEKSVATQISEAIAAENLSQYATDEELTALSNKVGTKDVATQISEAIAAENLSQYATDEELKAATDKIAELEGQIGEEDVADQIATAKGEANTYTDNAIAALDADKTSAAVEAGKGIQVQVVEVDGKITTVAVTGNYDNSYDAKGAATAAKEEAKAYADGLAVNYATAAQGAKADAALQIDDISGGSANGTIGIYDKENDSWMDVQVTGLDTAAYAKTTDFDAAGSASAVAASVKTTTDALDTRVTAVEATLEWGNISNLN